MPGTFFGIQIGASGLAAAQLGQDVTGHNIANAGTEGYSVQSAHIVAADPYTPPDRFSGGQVGMLGTGVVVGGITRARDQFLDQQVRSGTAQQSEQSVQDNALTQIQDAFGEPSDTGLNTAMGKLFQSFNNLVNNPEDIGVRTTVVQSGDALARVFHGVSDNLSSIGQQLSAKQDADMTAINSYGRQIAGLNATIRSSSANGQNANDLLDQRDLLLDKLSSLANVTITNSGDGTLNVSVGASQLVQGVDAYPQTLSGPDGLAANGNVTGGELGGLAQAQTDLAGYRTDLDNLAASVISTVNAVHQSGAGLDGSTGLNFFNGTDAASLSVNQALVTSPQKLAAAAEPAGGGIPAPGDASNATKLGALENADVGSGPLAGQTLQGFYQARIANLGGQGAATKTALASAGANVTQLTQQRESLTGVSTDSEMVNMMKYQQSYAASARVVQTMDSMLNTLINNLFSN